MTADEATAAACRYPAKKMFVDEDSARVGSEAIRMKVEARGDTYDVLHPYLCPGTDHWHLSHYPQGTATCPICHRHSVPAWFGGEVWVIAAHECAGDPATRMEKAS